MFVELSTGVRIDGTPVGAGMRIECPNDIGAYLVEREWARQVRDAHKTGDGRKLLALSVRDIPGTDQHLSEWPSWARPAWTQPDGRAIANGDNRVWVPVRCPDCGRHGYGPLSKLSENLQRDENSDARLFLCKRCRNYAA